MEPAVQRHRFTVEEYARMGDAGIFCEDDRVELIHDPGWWTWRRER